MIYGEPGAGKTFLSIDLMFAVALGIHWRGHKVKRGKVVYIATEGIAGLRSRIRAYALHHGISLSTCELSIIEDAPNLHTNDDGPLLESIKEAGGATVIVVDTLAQATPGANENSGQDMGMVIERCKRLAKGTNALVLLVHHSGKDPNRGPRGWSGFKGALDTEIEVIKNYAEYIARITKQKDGEGGLRFDFKLREVVLGKDEDGEIISNCIIEHLDQPSAKRHKFRGIWQEPVFRAACDLYELSDEPVPVTSIITKAIDTIPFNPGAGPKPKRDSRPDSALRALRQLSQGGIIFFDGKHVTVPHIRSSSQTDNCGSAA